MRSGAGADAHRAAGISEISKERIEWAGVSFVHETDIRSPAQTMLDHSLRVRPDHPNRTLGGAGVGLRGGADHGCNQSRPVGIGDPGEVVPESFAAAPDTDCPQPTRSGKTLSRVKAETRIPSS